MAGTWNTESPAKMFGGKILHSSLNSDSELK